MVVPKAASPPDDSATVIAVISSAHAAAPSPPPKGKKTQLKRTFQARKKNTAQAHFSSAKKKTQLRPMVTGLRFFFHLFFLKNLAKSAPPLRFNIPVPSSRNVLLFCT
jgi:hypothetical protein